MNLLGKILVVFIFVASVCFMGLAVVVHATHVNWKNAVLRTQDQIQGAEELGLKYQLEQTDAQHRALQDEKQRLQLELARAVANREQRLGQLQTETAELKKQRDDLQRQQADLTTQVRDALARAQEAEMRLNTNQQEVQRLRQETVDLRQQRDDVFQQTVDIEDQIAQAAGEYEQLTRRHEQLKQQVNSLNLAVQDAEIQLDREGPPMLHGHVLASAENGYVEISLGSDDGLEKGHTLEVYRLGATPEASQYLGRIRVLRTHPERAVAFVIPELRKGKIRREDLVATRLN